MYNGWKIAHCQIWYKMYFLHVTFWTCNIILLQYNIMWYIAVSLFNVDSLPLYPAVSYGQNAVHTQRYALLYFKFKTDSYYRYIPDILYSTYTLDILRMYSKVTTEVLQRYSKYTPEILHPCQLYIGSRYILLLCTGWSIILLSGHHYCTCHVVCLTVCLL